MKIEICNQSGHTQGNKNTIKDISSSALYSHLFLQSHWLPTENKTETQLCAFHTYGYTADH